MLSLLAPEGTGLWEDAQRALLRTCLDTKEFAVNQDGTAQPRDFMHPVKRYIVFQGGMSLRWNTTWPWSCMASAFGICIEVCE